MKTSITFAASMLAAIGCAQAVNATGSGGYGADSPFNRLYDRNRQVVFSGRVTGKAISPPSKGMGEAISILVRTARKQTVTVELGPRWYVANQVARVNVGDRVRVIGSRASFSGQSVVLAKNIVNEKNNRVLALRDFGGDPNWVASRASANVAIPSDAMGGTILSTSTVNYNGTPYAGYVLQTPNGNVNILTAPQWYMAGQDYSIPVGTYVQVVGAGAPINVGNHTILVNSLYSGNNTFTFMNNGVPVWYGYGG